MIKEIETIIRNVYLNEIYTDVPHGLGDDDIEKIAQALAEHFYEYVKASDVAGLPEKKDVGVSSKGHKKSSVWGE